MVIYTLNRENTFAKCINMHYICIIFHKYGFFMNKISIKSLSKKFGNNVVLDDVSISTAKGSVLALLGTSGSGKSTLLKCINLLEKPDSGTIEIDGMNLDYSQPKMTTKLRKQIGMVFQQFNLWPHLTVLQNLILAPIAVLKKKKAAVILQAERLLAKIGMLDKAYAYPLQLSGGQQQRVAIARALMMNPEIMLFDEPTSALDPELKNEVLKVMQTLASEGMTMLIATHEIGFAKEVASHALFLEQGQVGESGTVKEMLNNPKTERLQQFLESVNY